MELIAIGFLLGIVTCFVIAGCGMYYAEKMANRKHKRNNDDTDCRDVNNRMDRSNRVSHRELGQEMTKSKEQK